MSTMHFACKCGDYRADSDTRFADCDVCDKCGSTLAPVGEEYPAPAEHTWATRYHERTGKAYRVCLACQRREGWGEACEP